MARDISRQNATLSPDAVPESFTLAQVLAMGSLLSGRTVTSAARAASVSRSTVHRWLSEDPAFMAFHGQARKEMGDAVEQGLRVLSGSAVVALRRLLTRRSVPDSVKLQAAVAILKFASKPVEGPTEVEDAKNSILNLAKKRERDAMLARIGMSKHDLIKRLDETIEADGLDDLDDGKDDLEADDFEDEEDEDE